MNPSEKLLEFDKIKELWASFALTDRAKKEIFATTPCLNETTLNLLQKETTEAKQMIEKYGIPPLISLSDMEHILDVAEKEGCLTCEQLEYVSAMLTAVKRLKDYLNHGKAYDYALAYYEDDLTACPQIVEAIDRQVRNGRIDDYATKLLLSIRTKIDEEQTKMNEKADQIMRTHKDCMADSFRVSRNGRLCVPVKKEARNKIPGSVLDKSSSGNTYFIEPTSVAKYYDSIQMLKMDEENEEMRIRYELTAMILMNQEFIRQNITIIEKLDFAFSKGKLSFEYDGCRPLINTKRQLSLKNARHPLMEKNLCVPLQFHFEEGIRGIIITGPNTGGKTVALKTIALNSMMAQCGLHVACKEADICMNSNYLVDIGDGQNLSENLSTFSAHLKNIMNILDNLTKESLVILDELGSGTDPMEGMGIGIAILEALKQSGCLFLVTTHYPEIKNYAAAETAILNARMDFNKETLLPLYKLIIGEAGESQAFSIAKRLGMSDEMLKIAAKYAYGDANAMTNIPTGTNAITENIPTHSKTSVKIAKQNTAQASGVKNAMKRFSIGDSVIVYPDKKIGIVCKSVNEKGVLQVQMPDKKIWINHKRVKLYIKASELYPEDYDFSIIFDSVEYRKMNHQMSRKYVQGQIIELDTE